MKEITDEKLAEYEIALGIAETQGNINFILSNIRAAGRPTNFAPDKTPVRGLKQVVLPKEGGILTYYEGGEHPRKGFPHNDTLERVDEIKKFFKGLAFGFIGFRGRIILLVFLLLFRKRLTKSIRTLLSEVQGIFMFHLLKPERYCICVREVYQAIPDDTRVRDILCMVLEFDDAYRYRFQDIVGELNKNSFARNPIKELDRLLFLAYTRESDVRLQRTWKNMRQLLFCSFFFRDIRNQIIEFFRRIDPEKVKMDEADRYQASFKDGYKWNH